MIIRLQDGDILTFQYGGISTKIVYDSYIDGEISLDTDEESAYIGLYRKGKQLFGKD